MTNYDSSGRHRPSLNTLIVLGDFFNIDLETLIRVDLREKLRSKDHGKNPKF